MSLLPHRYPFLLVDRVLELEPGRRIVAIKNVSVNEPFFQGHWPALPIMPGVLIIEALAQAAGVLFASCIERGDRVALITTIDGVKLRRPVAPGDQLRLEVIGDRVKTTSASVSGVAKVGDAVAAVAKLRFMLVDARAQPDRSTTSPPVIPVRLLWVERRFREPRFDLYKLGQEGACRPWPL